MTTAVPAMEPGFPILRLRRLRSSPPLRRLVRETVVSIDHLIQPLFVVEGEKVRREIPSLPGQHHLSPDEAAREGGRLAELGIPAVLLFGQPVQKKSDGSSAYDERGCLQRAVGLLRKEVGDRLVIATDVCLCAYLPHGHCGLVEEGPRGPRVDNDRTLPVLARTACSHAAAGADWVAPSDMMDGRVGAIRAELDRNGFPQTAILAYAAKYASAFYGPFRGAVDSAPAFGDRSAYQMDPANVEEALREVQADLAEGADLVMIKPALAYLDVVRRVKETCSVPVAVYNVSGEYAMVQAAAQRGWMEKERAVVEMLQAMRRAGADIIVTYWAREAAPWLSSRRG
jgi:porphobilinogen synthase